jgi:hypothetical protein
MPPRDKKVMSLSFLEPTSQAIIRECLRATADGPFFPDWEFGLIMGVDRNTVRKVWRDWPELTVPRPDFQCAIRNSLNNLVGYPHVEQEAWPQYISVPPEQVRDLLTELIASGVLQ